MENTVDTNYYKLIAELIEKFPNYVEITTNEKLSVEFTNEKFGQKLTISVSYYKYIFTLKFQNGLESHLMSVDTFNFNEFKSSLLKAVFFFINPQSDV